METPGLVNRGGYDELAVELALGETSGRSYACPGELKGDGGEDNNEVEEE
jgi:hypothetical protein